MKRFTGLIILLFFLCTSLSAQSTKIQSAYSNVRAEARAQNKMILLYFTDHNSKPEEKKIERLLWTSPEFKSIASTYVVFNLKASRTRKNTSKIDIYETRLLQSYNDKLQFPKIVLLDTLGNRTGVTLTDFTDKAISEFLNKLQSY